VIITQPEFAIKKAFRKLPYEMLVLKITLEYDGIEASAGSSRSGKQLPKGSNPVVDFSWAVAPCSA